MPRKDNKSGCTGVSFVKKTGKWSARISRDGKRHHLGFFDDLEDAIAARKAAEAKFPRSPTEADELIQRWIENADSEEVRQRREEQAQTDRHRAYQAAFQKEWADERRDEINRKQREKYAENPEIDKARGAQWRADNPKKYKAQIRRQTERYQEDEEYRQYKLEKCKESYERRFPAIQEYERMRWERDKEKLSEYRKKWREENAEELAIKKAAWLKEDREKNPAKYHELKARRRAAELQRTPPWADMEAIKFFYDNCPEGCHVDHVIPLQGETVSGLHVHENLQWLTATENLMKGNSFDGDDFDWSRDDDE